MRSKLISVIIYLIIMFGVGFYGGWLWCEDKYNEQLSINKTLYTVIEELERDYDELDLQYNRDLQSCYTLLNNCQESTKERCYLNGGWNCE